MRIGVLGCGDISGNYLDNLSHLFENTEVYALCSRTQSKARARAEEYGVGRVLSWEEMLADPAVDVVLNLTTPDAHEETTRQALLAGKHVYVEKPLGVTYAQAYGLKKLAEARGLTLACAPDTFLGAACQTARRFLDSGMLGDVLSCYAFCLNHGTEAFHPRPEYMYRPGGEPMLGRAPYYLSALVFLVGPLRRVAAINTRGFTQRVITSKPQYGKRFPVEIDTNNCGILQFDSGASCMLAMSRDVWGSTVPHIELHGTKGSMLLPEPIYFGGDVQVKLANSEGFVKLPACCCYERNSRGIGLSDMIDAIERHETPRASAALACHTTEIAEAFTVSWREKRFITLQSHCDRPEPLPDGLLEGRTRV